MREMSMVHAVPALTIRSRISDYAELTKPRIALLVLCTVVAGYCVANAGVLNPVNLFHVIIGTGLVAAGASALNQLLERQTDGMMRRTENRPLPAGRLTGLEVLMLGLFLGATGLAYLTYFLPNPLCPLLAGLTFASYVGIYTPLKRWTTLNTLVGAVPGALPPLIGFTALQTTISLEGVLLFLVLFLWQIPHFLAIAWIYREDYARAGLRMFPCYDKTGKLTGRQMILYSGCLLLVTLVPVVVGKTGLIYLICMGLTGISFLYLTIRFYQQPGNETARNVLRGSLLHLPLTMTILLTGLLIGL